MNSCGLFIFLTPQIRGKKIVDLVYFRAYFIVHVFHKSYTLLLWKVQQDETSLNEFIQAALFAYIM